jgi:D-3-phosphoglycerate dehydrogenase
MYRILIVDELLAEGVALLREAADVDVDDVRLGREALLEQVGNYHALIVRSGTPVDAALLRRGRQLRVVARAGRLFDNIDVAEATAQGIMVMHTPQAYSVAAAEHTLALMLALARHVPQADRAARRGDAERSTFMGGQLCGKTLGLVGFGRVGQLVAARARAFEMRVLAYDPYMDEDEARQAGVTAATLDEVLTRADFLTLHAALTPETERLIGPAEIERMKVGARLVNCARAELVDEAALGAALRGGRLAGAALDVYREGSPLLALPNVVAAPHLAGSTLEAQQAVSVEIAQQVLDALRGTDYRNVVNLPFITGPDFARTRPYLELAEKLGALQRQLAGGPPRRLEVEVKGEGVERLVKPVAVALLKGLLDGGEGAEVNYINAPMLAARRGLTVSQARGLEAADYTHLVSCRLSWEGGQRLVAGTLFGGAEPRVVVLDEVRTDARPAGHVLVMRSRDIPGVIGAVGTLLARHQVNIAEWRLGRDAPGGTAVSFINLDCAMPPGALEALRALPQVIEVSELLL